MNVVLVRVRVRVRVALVRVRVRVRVVLVRVRVRVVLVRVRVRVKVILVRVRVQVSNSSTTGMSKNVNCYFRRNRLINEYTLLHHRELFYDRVTTKCCLHHLPIITYLSLSTYQNPPIIIYHYLPIIIFIIIYLSSSTYHKLPIINYLSLHTYHYLPIIIYLKSFIV